MRERRACNLQGCTLPALHSGVCSVRPPAHKRRAPAPKRLVASDWGRKRARVDETLDREDVERLFGMPLEALLATPEECVFFVDGR